MKTAKILNKDLENIKIQECLDQDLKLISEQLEREKDTSRRHSWSRLYVRTAVTLMETLTTEIKYHFVTDASAGYISLSADEILLLNNKRPELKSNGEIHTRNNQAPLDYELKFIIKLANRVYGKHITEVDIGDAGFEAIKKAVEIRNLITHPKTADKLNIGFNECSMCDKALVWFYQVHIDLLKTSSDLKNQKIKTLNSVLSESVHNL